MSEWQRNPRPGVTAERASTGWTGRSTIIYDVEDGEVMVESDDNEDGILVSFYLPADLLAAALKVASKD